MTRRFTKDEPFVSPGKRVDAKICFLGPVGEFVHISRDYSPDGYMISTADAESIHDFVEASRGVKKDEVFLQVIAKVWDEAGVNPRYHRKAQDRLRREWPMLARVVQAIAKREAS